MKNYCTVEDDVSISKLNSIKYCELMNIKLILEGFLTETTKPEVKGLYLKAVDKLNEVIELT